ncbi:LysR family transcriptional regulator [Pinirhizobacter sp.]|jgi:DNA-binding transcriptional LysR family regulator|uniref:LysR family transcriptional regulator n=1 Tax=Pinirhizobacter sp. TaxID=2950432 RepID=UPI002F3F086A
MDRLAAIRAFGRVVETGSFTRAATSMQLPNASVTKMIQALEASLGVRLLQRTTRRVTVTVEGAEYYERTRSILGDLDDLETTLVAGGSNPQGTLRVDTGGSVASGIILPKLGQFRARYPGIRVQLGVTDRTTDLIGENIDCAVRSTADDGSLVVRKLGTLAFRTCATPAYLAKAGTPSVPNDILHDGHAVVGYFSARSGQITPLRFKVAGATVEINATAEVVVNESNTHVAAAVSGLGLVQTLAFAADPYIASGRLVSLLDDFQPDPIPAYLVFPPGRQNIARVRVFAEWVATLFSG